MPRRAKFSGTDFSTLPSERLGPVEEPGIGFKPVRGEFASFWRSGMVERETRRSICQSWVLRSSEGMAAYVTLLADKLDYVGLLEDEGIHRGSFPAIKIGLLAADHRAKGAGTALVVWVFQHNIDDVRPRVGVRFVTVDAFCDPDSDYNTVPYYQRFGFRLIDQSDDGHRGFRSMYLDLEAVVAG